MDMLWILGPGNPVYPGVDQSALSLRGYHSLQPLTLGLARLRHVLCFSLRCLQNLMLFLLSGINPDDKILSVSGPILIKC